LFYVYPLKFLFSLLFGDSIYGSGKSPFSIREGQMPQLMIVYSVGYIILYVVLLLLYTHALRCRTRLELTTLEVFDTWSKIGANVIMIIIGVISLLIALVLPKRSGGLAGWVYPLIGPAMWIFYARRARLRGRLLR
jgi:hypothetical protein